MNKKAFTLVELLAVIAILALLVIIALPNIMSMFEESKRKSFENEVKNIYKTVEEQVISDIFNNPNSKEKMYSSSSTSENHLSLKGRSNLKYCVVVNGANKITKLYISDGNYQYISEDINELSNIENIHVEELADIDISDIEKCELPSTDPSLFTYTVSNNKVTINGFKSSLLSFRVVDMDKCVAYLDGRNYSNSLTLCAEGGTPGLVSYDIYKEIPPSDYEIAGLNVTDNRPKALIIPEEIDGYPVTNINQNAFSNNHITSLNIPDSVISIGILAFNNNDLPDSQAFIYERTDTNNDGIAEIDYSTLNSYGGVNKNVTIPNNVITIEYGAFSNCDITSLTIPNSVTSIEFCAFYSNKITTLTIPDSVTSIKEYAFYHNQLTSLTIPNSVTSIGHSAFNDNQLPDSEAFIYKRTSSGIDNTTVVSYGGSKKEVIIPNNIKSIVGHAFEGNKITSVTVPSSVTSILDGAFNNNRLESVKIKGKSSSSEFSTYGSGIWGWNSDIICTKDNTSNVANGCIIWNAS